MTSTDCLANNETAFCANKGIEDLYSFCNFDAGKKTLSVHKWSLFLKTDLSELVFSFSEAFLMHIKGVHSKEIMNIVRMH